MSASASSTRGRAARKDATINVRVPLATRDLIDSAADIAGKTRTEFMLDSARQAATDVLLDQKLFALSEERFQAFLDAMDSPPEPTAELRALLRNPAPWDR